MSVPDNNKTDDIPHQFTENLFLQGLKSLKSSQDNNHKYNKPQYHNTNKQSYDKPYDYRCHMYQRITHDFPSKLNPDNIPKINDSSCFPEFIVPKYTINNSCWNNTDIIKSNTDNIPLIKKKLKPTINLSNEDIVPNEELQNEIPITISHELSSEVSTNELIINSNNHKSNYQQLDDEGFVTIIKKKKPN